MPGYGRGYKRRSTGRTVSSRRRFVRSRSSAATKIQRVVRQAKKRQFRRTVQRAVRPVMETKQRQVKVFGLTSLAGNVTGQNCPGAGLGSGMVHVGGLFQPNIFSLLTFNKGTALGDRIGQRIQNCRLSASVCVTANEYNPASNTSQYSCDLYMIVLRDRNEKSTVPDQLKMQPNNTTYYIDGTARNAFLPFNREKYIIYSNKRVARFRAPARLVSQQPTPVPGDALANPQNSYGTSFRNFRCSLPCPKELLFTQAYGGTSTTPADKTPQNASCAVGFYYINGSGEAMAAGQEPLNLSMTLKLTFTDA